MSRALHQALDQALCALEQGQPLGACLSLFARRRAQLEGRLRVAAQLTARRDALQADAETLERVRVRVLEQTRQLALPAGREATSLGAQARYLPLARAHRWAPGRALLTVPGVVMLLVGLFGGGSMVSARSLPGDPLYGLKRASESVRVALVFDREHRAALQERLELVRLGEVQAVVDQRREVQVDFGGHVECAAGDTITVQGLEVLVVTANMPSTPPTVGCRVRVVAETQPDGSLVARSVTLLPEEPGHVEPAAPPLTATHEPLPSSTATLGPPTPTIRTPDPTPIPSATPSLRPTARPTDEPTRAPTEPPAPTRPADTHRPTPQQPKPAPVPAATALAPHEVTRSRIDGVIEEIGADNWVIAGQRVTINDETRINPPDVTAEVGCRANAHTLLLPDGQHVAFEITLVPSSPRAAPSPTLRLPELGAGAPAGPVGRVRPGG